MLSDIGQINFANRFLKIRLAQSIK